MKLNAAKYTMPWGALLPVFGMTLLCMSMKPMVDWYQRFDTEGKVRTIFQSMTDFQPKRRAMDYFDYIMAERDETITGSMYRQQSHPFPSISKE